MFVAAAPPRRSSRPLRGGQTSSGGARLQRIMIGPPANYGPTIVVPARERKPYGPAGVIVVGGRGLEPRTSCL